MKFTILDFRTLESLQFIEQNGYSFAQYVQHDESEENYGFIRIYAGQNKPVTISRKFKLVRLL